MLPKPRGPSRFLLPALVATLLVAPALAPNAAAEARVYPLPDEFTKAMERLADEMDAGVPFIRGLHEESQPNLTAEAMRVAFGVRSRTDEGHHSRAFEQLRLYEPLLARLNATAEANRTGESVHEIALRMGAEFNATAHARARELHTMLREAQGRATTPRAAELLLLAGTLLVEGEYGLDLYETFRADLSRRIRDNRLDKDAETVMQGVLSWSSGARVAFRMAELLIEGATSAPATGSVRLAPGAWNGMASLAADRVGQLPFQPFEWYAKKVREYRGTEEHAYMMGLYLNLNATLFDNELQNQLQGQQLPYSRLRDMVQAGALKQEQIRPALALRGLALHFTDDALSYYNVLAERYNEVKGNSEESLKLLPSYQKAAHLIVRAQDAAVWLNSLPVTGLATTESDATPATPVWMAAVLGAVAGGAAVGIVVSIVLTSKRK